MMVLTGNFVSKIAEVLKNDGIFGGIFYFLGQAYVPVKFERTPWDSGSDFEQ